MLKIFVGEILLGFCLIDIFSKEFFILFRLRSSGLVSLCISYICGNF